MNQAQIVPECQPEEAVSIENFIAEILEKQVDLWWKLPPVLLAGVCASRYWSCCSILKLFHVEDQCSIKYFLVNFAIPSSYPVF